MPLPMRYEKKVLSVLPPILSLTLKKNYYYYYCKTPCGDHSGDLTSRCWSPKAAQYLSQTHQHNFGCMQTVLGVLWASW